MKSKLRHIFLLIAAIYLCMAQQLYAADTQTVYKSHTVAKGETIYSIASAYKISVNELYSLNPEVEKGVRVNQVIKIPLAVNAGTKKQTTVLHSIQAKETLYSVSKHYNIPIEDIIADNPGLSADNFKIGYAIYIPTQSGGYASNSRNQSIKNSNDNKIIHQVLSKETLYSIAKQYDISMGEIADANPEIKESGLKKDMTLVIPSKSHTKSSNVSTPETISIAERPVSYSTTKANKTMKIGLLLPFLNKQDYQQARFIEFYEGFLLAVEDIKAQGYSADIYVFDIRKGNNTKKLESLLETYEMKSLNLIIGGVTDEEIGLLSQFADNNNIKYVVPFPVKNEKITLGNNTYQANISQPILYEKVADKFYQQFKSYNIIIAQDNAADNDKLDFTNTLKKTLDKYYITSHTIQVANIAGELKDALSSTKKNIIIPTSSSLMTLSRIIPTLKNLKAEDSFVEVNLFGYPDWQAYSAQFLQDFFKLGTYIYTPFYADSNNSKTQQFYDRYRKWYGKTLISTFPKYGLLGYDMGLYFMTATAQNLGSLEKNTSLINIPTLQSTFYFDKADNQRGYINTGVYFVNYKPDMTVEKIDYSR